MSGYPIDALARLRGAQRLEPDDVPDAELAVCPRCLLRFDPSDLPEDSDVCCPRCREVVT